MNKPIQVRPELITDPEADPAISSIIDHVRNDLDANPMAVADGIRVLDIGATAVRRVLDYIGDHPDGSDTLGHLLDFMEHRADLACEFDDASEAAAAEVSSKVSEGSGNLTPEQQRDKIRRSRLTILATRWHIYREDQTGNADNPAA